MKDVPIGLIRAPVGSTVAETWLSRKDLIRNKAFAYYVNELDAMAEEFPEMKTNMEELGPKWLKSHSTRIRGRKSRDDAGETTSSLIEYPYPRKVPTLMHNGMINPLIPYAIRGVIWWQDGGNARTVERAFEYRQLFPYLIEC